MKVLKKYLYILTVIVLGSGCEGFLDKNPTDQLSSGLFWKSKSDFDNALAAVYGTLQNSIYSFGVPNWDVITDNGYGQHNYEGSNGIVQGNIFPSSGGYISSVYTSSYQAIARINIFLENLEAYQGEDMDNDLKMTYEGETKFIRAFYYFQLYTAYGSVPIVTEPLNFENQHQEKRPATEVFDQVISDLDEAIELLPEEAFYNSNGHAVKASAEALKVRVLLFVAYDENGNAQADIMQSAKEHVLSVMESGYELDEEYTHVFQDATQEGNQEIIFSIKFLAPDNSTPMDQWYGDWLVVSPLQNMVDEYEYIDGLPFGESPLTDADAPFSNRDPRLGHTIFVDEVDWGGGNTHRPSNDRPTGYGLKKFLTPELTPYGYSTRSQQDWVLLRYADILLMYAEIENELEGPTASVYEAVDAVRNRSEMPGLPQGLSQEEMRQRIRHERRVELAFEGLRYYDLKRWKIAGEVLNNVDDGIIPYNFEDRFYHWPIPQSEIDKSDGILVQNPDY
ncbi:MAG: RagB/SusD family nutrient uptake outer membrane protein [Anditalea sp.]